MKIENLLGLSKEEKHKYLSSLTKEELFSIKFNQLLEELNHSITEQEEVIIDKIIPDFEYEGLRLTTVINEPIRVLKNKTPLSLSIYLIDDTGVDGDYDTGYYWSKDLTHANIRIRDLDESPDDNDVDILYGSGGANQGVVKVKSKDGYRLVNITPEETIVHKAKAMELCGEYSKSLRDLKIRQEIKPSVQKLNELFDKLFLIEDLQREINQEIQNRNQLEMKQSVATFASAASHESMERMTELLSEKAKNSNSGQANVIIYSLKTYRRQDDKMVAQLEPHIISANKNSDGRILFSISKPNRRLNWVLADIDKHHEGRRISRNDLIENVDNFFHLPNSKAKILHDYLQNKAEEKEIRIEKIVLDNDDISNIKELLSNRHQPKNN